MSVRWIVAIAVVALVSVFAVSAMAAVGGTIRPLPRTVLPEGTPEASSAPVAAGGDKVRAPEATAEGASQAPTDAAPAATPTLATPTPTANGQGFWPGTAWVRPRLPMTHPVAATPEPSGTPPPTHDPGDATIAEADGLVAVLVVGPSGETPLNITRAEEFAAKAEKYGMVVRRLYSPFATWGEVLVAAQGANLLAYWGHGNGWPSPYGNFQEQTKDGMGLNRSNGDTSGETVYYGAAMIRKAIQLAPNAVVVLSHLCYSAGNAEPDLPIPGWDVAWQRVDNHANGFLQAGASAVFAYGTGDAAVILDGLFKGNKTMDQIFMTRGREARPYYGFTGWDDRYLESTRVPGSTMHLDPGQTEGFLRAITGDLEMTSATWRASAPAQ